MTERRKLRVLSGILIVCLSAFAGIPLPAEAQTTAPNEWTWMGGSNTGLAAGGNIPSARYQATTWTDKSGNFWLFGGSEATPGVLNDLWKLNPSTGVWVRVTGSSTSTQPGVYGTMGTPSAQNTPGAREEASGWTDNNGNLWLFGGHGYDAAGDNGVLNDLWEFNPSTSEWTWMSGSSTVGNSCFAYDIGETVCALPAVYGTQGTPAAGNTPGSREAATTWTDNQGNFWLFGGWSYDVAVGVQYYFNELWEYNPSTSQWAWMGGSSTRDGSACLWNLNLLYLTCGEPGVSGEIGVADPGNVPGGRAGSAAWTDSQGNLWLFSGSGFDAGGYFGDPNDMWEFNLSADQWIWMGGNDLILPSPCEAYDCSGPTVYGTLGTPGAGNIPQGRDHAVGWTDTSGNLWLFGGGGGQVPDDAVDEGLNDLWEFNPSTKEWALMGGNIEAICGFFCTGNLGAVYGELGVPAPGNNPGTRFAAAGWTDSKGNFWLFGGLPQPAEEAPIFDNDLWVYQPSNGPLPTTATPTFSLSAGSYPSAQSVMISDATNGATIYYTTDGTTPTISSNAFNPSTMPPINIQHSETMKAIAVAGGCLTSAVATAVYTLPPQAAPPSFSLPTGTYTSFQTVTISDITPAATIYYTTNGLEPTTSSTVYSGPLSIVAPYTPLRAAAIATGYSLSNVTGANYTLNLPYVATPTFSVGGGTYNTPQTVTISDSTPGATIYYEINIGYPTTSSPVYTGPITVSSNETIWAMATANNYFPSGYSGADYAINPLAAQTATPTFSLPAGAYAAPQTVTISDSTAGAFIYYTTDGSTPTTNSTFYTGPVNVSSTETLQAMAVVNGSVASAVATAAYTINLPPVPPGFSISGTAISVAPGAATGNTSTITLTPSGGFTGAINLSCTVAPAAASHPATCSLPASATISGSAVQTVTLTVNTTPASSALNRAPGFFWPSVGGAALSCILLVGIPCRRRKRWITFGMLVLVISVGGVLGCGAGGNGGGGGGTGIGGGGGGGGNPGTTPGTYTITVTGTSGAITQTGTISLSVQ